MSDPFAELRAMQENLANLRWSPAQEPWFPWVVWLFGPASFAAVLALCFVYPVFTEIPECLPLGLALVFTHFVSAVLFAWHVVVPGPHRRSPAFWLLIAYWVGIVLLLVSATLRANDRDPALPKIAFLACMTATLGVPVVGAILWARTASRQRTIVILNLAGAGSGMLIAMLAFPVSNELGDFMRPELIAMGGTLGLCVTGAYSVWRWGCEP